MAVMVYKPLHNLAPDYLRATFVDRDSVTSYALRDNANKLAVPQPRTIKLSINTDSFRYSGAILWNSLHKQLRQAESLSIFKSVCKTFFYS